jgi:rhodanese-related sulfurtransferase
MSATGARAFLAAHPEALVLDVRNPDEWNDEHGHIEGARQIPLPELADRVGEVAAWKDKPIVLVCRSGRRSQTAAEMLAGLGYRQVINLEGGMIAWQATAPGKP